MTNAYQAVQDRANTERVGASAETKTVIQAAVNSATQLYDDGIVKLVDSVGVAQELLEDQCSESSNE